MITVHYPTSASVNGTLTYSRGVASYRYENLSTAVANNRTDPIDLIDIADKIGGPVKWVRLFVDGIPADGSKNPVLTLRFGGDQSAMNGTTETVTANGYSDEPVDASAVRFVDALVTTAEAAYAVNVQIVMQSEL